MKLRRWALFGIALTLISWVLFLLSWKNITGQMQNYNNVDTNRIFYGVTSIAAVISIFFAFAGFGRTKKGSVERSQTSGELDNQESSERVKVLSHAIQRAPMKLKEEYEKVVRFFHQAWLLPWMNGDFRESLEV